MKGTGTKTVSVVQASFFDKGRTRGFAVCSPEDVRADKRDIS